MSNYKSKSLVIFLFTWTIFVCLLFLHVSSKADFSFFKFYQSRGVLTMIEDSYNGNTNLVSLREKIYAIPHGIGFDHPNRKKLLKKNNVFVAYSHNEAREMVDMKTENIPNKFNLVKENYGNLNIFKSGHKFFIMPAIDPNSGMPIYLKNLKPYKEYYVGNSYQEALVNIKKFQENVK